MQTFFQQVINGLSLGSIYALLALGYTMVYGIIKLINFAHGDIYMIGAFWGYYVINQYHVDFGVALVSAMAVSAILGMVIEYLAYRPLRHSPRITALITAIGVSYFLENGMSFLFGANTWNFPQVIGQARYTFFGVTITNIQLLIVAVALVLMVGLQLIVQHTRMGTAMRAVAVDQEAAELVGIDPNHIISFTFGLGSALAGAAGVLIGLYYNSIDPLMGMVPGIKAFVAAVVGGIGSIPGAAIGGFLIGLLETFVQAIGLSAYKDAAVYIVLIIILIVLPAGLLGKNVKEKV
ncbi:MAG: branched-chain amino acid ABC transporter permease [Lactobacillus sp.]|uniref:Branched-chain amino acid ABC transporter permease n=1 Tax=Lacticaseibacillus suilingensis TaxID=2799577 RepID=A0ABW4BCA1_9LACO|nr:branched-chain amino acid ABC transporter permease [Lacticaseibacillus suilingensis]MCI1895171.1 branched-chain amino acid ABC transporter permease [Lactobacillus sp.]MCI1917917.1 branched-chain amino acid ABC transporter permease [Lactobacillus sp.]MCI1940927.1 branched-chain amino acid ABC transporter permease [Lactobacillus sp.]MCI1971600.1 branched-chain amino acid ABC transporter permease [Lactobacillus sp.]MCI2017469.1 branched-chain amino acid ABC transporter permease [Lactobacillus 